MQMNIHAIVSTIALIWYMGLFAILLKLGAGRPAWRASFGVYLGVEVLNQVTLLMISMATTVAAAAPLYWALLPLEAALWPVYLLFVRSMSHRPLWSPMTRSAVVLAVATAASSLIWGHRMYAGFYMDADTGLVIPELGPAVGVMGSVMFIFLCLSFFELVRSRREAGTDGARQLFLFLLLGFVLSTAGMISNASALLRAYPLDVLTNVLNGSLIAVGLARFRSGDLPYVARRAVISTITRLLLCTGFYLAVVVMLWATGKLAVDVTMISAAIALSAFLVAAWLDREGFNRVMDRAVFLRDHHQGSMVQRISHRANSEMLLEQLTGQILEDLQETMSLAWCALLLRDPGAERFDRVTSRQQQEGAVDLEKLVELAAQHRDGPAVAPAPGEPPDGSTGGITRVQIAASAGRGSATDVLLVPMVVRGVTTGLLAVGPRKTAEPYTELDRFTLTTLANQIATAVEKARLHQELREELARRRRGDEERTRMQEQMLQLHKMEALGSLASGVAHDMNNVLAAIMSIADAARIDLGRGQGVPRVDLDNIVEACRRGRELTDGLLGFARRHALETEPLQVGDVIDAVAALLQRTIPKGIAMERQAAPGVPPVDASSTQLQSVLMNLCVNAVQAMHERGRLTLSTRAEDLTEPRSVGEVTLAPGRYALLCVEDSGPGMDEQTRRRVFDPFFTTKQDSGGTGLGLSLVYGIVRSYKGAISLCSAPAEGTRITLWFPASAGQIPQPHGPAREREVQGQRFRFLVVDDEEMVRLATKRVLESYGHEVVPAGSGGDALDLLQQGGPQFHAVILDMMMPEMNGTETFHRLRKITPEMPVILCSGYSEEQEGRDLLSFPGVAFVAKPFDVETLLLRLDELRGLDPHHEARAVSVSGERER